VTADVEHDGNRGLPVTAAPTLPGPKVPAPLAALPTLREQQIVAVADTAAALEAPDLAILAWIAEHLPVAKLQATCTEIKERGRVPALAPNTYEPTSAEHVALAALLVAAHDVSVLLHGRGLRGGT
jgi:hypothetical protein